MQELIAQVDSLASVVMSADPEDLPGLAEAHSRLEKLACCIDQMGSAADTIAPVRDRADSARKLLEKLILNEVEDASESFATITRTVAQLQQMLEQVSGGHPLEPSEPAELQGGIASDSGPASSKQLTSQAPRVFTEDDLPLVREFIGESTSHIESAEADLLKLEEEPDDTEAISSIFRAFHSIKGVAGFLNLEAIQRLAHAAENLLDRARQGQLQLTGQASDLVMQSIDRMKLLVGQLDQAIRSNLPYQAGDVTDLCNRLDEFVRIGPTEPAGSNVVCKQAGGEKTESAAGSSDTETKRSGAISSADSSIKVSTERLDSLINMVGELVIAQSMVGQDVGHIARENPRLARHVAHLGKITRELQDLSMSLRMIPLTGVFRKMARVVRDVARKAGKQVEFIQTGADTELDRNVVEQIADPLVHMVRNSVDHGIETPEQRQAAGKPPVGRVELKAYHQAGNINIEVIDDGRGINKRRVLEKAIAAGLVGEQDQLSDHDIFKLLFHPGLSTAEKVTDISGRGVGMDVVKRNIEALRGRIDISSTEGQGSIFTIRLPLTLAVIDGLIVKVGTQKYILPISSIEQSLRPKIEQISTVQGRGEVCLVRGALLPILRLYELFRIEPKTTDPAQALFVIVQDNDRRVCLLVDELLGQEQVVIKSLGEGMNKLKGISGGAVLGDGNVSLILDVPGLVELAEQ